MANGTGGKYEGGRGEGRWRKFEEHLEEARELVPLTSHGVDEDGYDDHDNDNDE